METAITSIKNNGNEDGNTRNGIRNIRETQHITESGDEHGETV